MKIKVCPLALLLMLALCGPVRAAEPLPADWGILAFPALEDYNLVEFYLHWQTAAQTALEETVALGATRALVAKNWRELEPSAGQLKLDELRREITSRRALQQDIILSVQLINTVKREVPEDLHKTAWDDPAMVMRATALMEAALALLPGDRISYVVFGNEVDVYFTQHPIELTSYLTLFRQIRAMVQAKYPNVRLGIASAFDSVREKRSALIETLNRDTDVVVLTYYGVQALKVLPPDAPQKELPMMVSLAAGKPVVLQEVGYPSGAGVSSSEAQQAEFIRHFFAAWEKHRHAIPSISLFLQTDFGSRICQQLTDYYGMKDYKIQFADVICTLGLKDAHGRPKQGWMVLQNEIAPRLREGR